MAGSFVIKDEKQYQVSMLDTVIYGLAELVFLRGSTITLSGMVLRQIQSLYPMAVDSNSIVEVEVHVDNFLKVISSLKGDQGAFGVTGSDIGIKPARPFLQGDLGSFRLIGFDSRIGIFLSVRGSSGSIGIIGSAITAGFGLIVGKASFGVAGSNSAFS